jgi:hypothetical protein
MEKNIHLVDAPEVKEKIKLRLSNRMEIEEEVDS